ncbi:MAG: SsrA-binding protein SmpB [Candidatus Pacebacteria bacterium]|nr:SsrA-binding protein SmpB [Candidatus Paceibacterota bacterium]
MNLLVNKTVKRSYEILETFEAGIKLAGWEVKTLRLKHGSLKEAYVTIDDEVWLTSAFIPLYQPNQPLHESADPYQRRKLLLHTKQIQDLKESQKQKGLTVVPLRVYEKGQLIKIEIAIARGKKLHDKRKDLKDRSMKRDADRAMKHY